MPLIRRGVLVEDDFAALGADASIPETGAILVDLARFEAERTTLRARAGALGVRLKNSDSVASVAADLSRLALVALDFPKFQDGRAYSQARLLRERHGFAGEIRAVGNVLFDQLAFMRRCGVDAFEIADAQIAARFAAAFEAIGLVYQPAADGAETVIARRHPVAAPDTDEEGAPSPVRRTLVEAHPMDGRALEAPASADCWGELAAEAESAVPCAAFWAY